MGRFVRAVRRREGELASVGPAQVDAAVTALRLTLGRDGLGPGGLVEAFAVLSVVCAGVLGVRPYDTQLVAARIVLDNSLAEMATGEGKTLAVALAAATAALAGVPVHVITANDYLVSRDAEALHLLVEVRVERGRVAAVGQCALGKQFRARDVAGTGGAHGLSQRVGSSGIEHLVLVHRFESKKGAAGPATRRPLS